MTRQKEFYRRRLFFLMIICFIFCYNYKSSLLEESSILRTINTLFRRTDMSKYSKVKDLERKFRNFWTSFDLARLNYHHHLANCDPTWKKSEAVPWFKKTARTDPDKSYISAMHINPSGQASSVTLQSQYSNGSLKFIGGDYWRVFVRGQTSVPVLKTDLKNGSYLFTFLPVFPGDYSIKISLEYTLCDGIREPPFDWFIKGNIQGKDQPQGILSHDMPYINKPLWKGDEIRFNVPEPTANSLETKDLINDMCKMKSKCRYLWNGFGSWVNTTTWLPLCKGVHYHYPRKKKGVLWIFGDSVSSQFYYRIKNNKLCRQIFRTCMYSYNWVYSLENYNLTTNSYIRKNSTVQKTIWNTLDFSAPQVLLELKQALLNPSMDENSAILFNYGLHYTEATNFTNFQKVIQEVVKLRKLVRCKMIWRTTTSLNRHKYSLPNLHSRRFMTSQRVLLYNAYATNEFCNAGFDILDAYPLTDSYPLGTGSKSIPYDPVHYEYHVMKPLEQALEQVFT